MGRETLLAVLCWLVLNSISAKVISLASPIRVLDNINAASVSRLYRNVPLGVYASASPYAAYSFNVPTFVAPKNNNQNLIPLKEESVVIQNSQGFLRDSYGQKYQETPQSIAYKTTFPQQYVQLQNLPAHLSQPLVATSPNFQFRQVTPHFFGQSQFSVPNIQSFSPSVFNRYPQSSAVVSQPFVFQQNLRNTVPQQPSPITHSQIVLKPTAQPLTSIPKDSYVDTNTNENYSTLKSELQHHHINVQPVQARPENIEQNAKQSQQSVKKEKLQRSKVKDPIVTTHVNGETVVTIPTKPSLPLLDLSLLEPLTFDNPLVPQVQHFLPRINQATYHKLPNVNEVKKHQMEFIVQNTKSYDSSPKNKPKKESPKKKQKKPRPQNEHKDDEDENPIKSVTVISTPNESPEFSYEVNSPNYKETYTEKKVNYNKETQSEPVHYNYEKQTNKEPVHYSYEKHTQDKPVHYSYVTSSKEPIQIKQIIYSNNKDQPKELIFHFKPEEKAHNYEERVLSSPQTSSEEESLNGSTDSDNGQEQAHLHDNNHNNHPVSQNKVTKHSHHSEPEHREDVSSHKNNRDSEYQGHVSNTPVQHEGQHFQPITPEYEEDITILSTPQTHVHSSYNENVNDHGKSHNKHISHSQGPPKHYHSSYTPHQPQYSPEPVIYEKSKRIIIKEESPDESQPDHEQLMADMIKQQETNEDNFEKAYKNAAYGFPAYDAPPADVEKEIYNPESYGAAKYLSDYDVENTPLRQYQEEGDDYPTQSRASYKDEKDKMQEEYYLDYAISRPESVLERLKKKDDYYKMFSKQKPQKYFGEGEEKKKNAKYTLGSTFSFHPPQLKEHAAKQKSAPYVYGYNYPKEAPRDNSAYATRPNQRYKSKTQFVEPQYQYGFEPISIPQLLDSELAAMASNDNLESENPGTRKKVYKENWYIKKTTTGKAR